MKKLFAILGMITCMVGLCACGNKDAAEDHSNDSLIQVSDSLLQQMDMVVSQGAVEQYTADPVIYAGLVGWRDALKDDIGKFEGTNGGTAVSKDGEIIVNVNVLGSEHNASVEFIYNESAGGIVSITTNVEYSLGEIMLKAAMNTLIGMGTVFTVLILISLIISCFTLISKFEKKDEIKTATSDVRSEPVVAQIAEKEELSDDTELVAVIAAAIAAYEGSGSTDGFVVRSIRKSNKSKWQNA